jgi:hypothetical protein
MSTIYTVGNCMFGTVAASAEGKIIPLSIMMIVK